jgi:hypothetical protein
MKTEYEHVKFGSEDGRWLALDPQDGQRIGGLSKNHDGEEWLMHSYSYHGFGIEELSDILAFMQSLKEQQE